MILITARSNPKIKYVEKLLKSASYRRKNSCFVAEGLRVCYDAMLSRAQILSVFITEQAVERFGEKAENLIAASENTFMVTPELFRAISDTQTPQGVLCVIKTLDKTNLFDTIKTEGKYLALENVQDPNNLGTILRSAEAFGVDGIIMSADCCDIFNPKVVRGSMGAVFRIPFIVTQSIGGFLAAHGELNSYAAVVDNSAEKITDIGFELPCVTVVGNEGNGLTAETVNACKKKLTIPMNGKAESLNASVAASIIIWEMIK